MWFNRPAYSSYTPRYGYGYSSFENPHARAIARERAAREREAAAHRANLLRWQQMQDAARSPYNSYLSDDDEDTFVSYPYNLRAQNYVAHEDLKRQQILEQQRQLELARRADRREAKRVRELAEHTPKLQESTHTSAPHFSVPISSPGGSSSTTKPTQPPKYASPPPSPKPATPEATPEQIHAAMTIQEFYRNRMARGQALTSIAALSTQFEQFKSALTYPPQLDYRDAIPDAIITIPISSESFVRASSMPPSDDADDTAETSKSNPRLAFTSNNRVVLEYIENLNRLIEKLDGVESGGHALVREQRKQMIRNVEAEAQRMDRWIAAVWDLARPRAQAQPKPRSSRQLRPQPTMEDVFVNN